MQHVKVLLRKDLITLRRNVVFIVSFILFPFTLMLFYGKLLEYVSNEWRPEETHLESKCLGSYQELLTLVLSRRLIKSFGFAV